jgi:PAS domain S-box-containing protein
VAQGFPVAMNQELLKQLSDQKYALDQAAIVAATDAQGVITYVNDRFCEVSGYTRDELVGKTHRVINSGLHSKDFFRDLWKTISSGEVWRGEVCNRKKGGDLYWVNTTIVPFLDEKGKPLQYLSIRNEITELKVAQQTINEQQEKLMAASRLSAIGEMAAAITHEINNPLGVILGRAEMLKSMLEEKDLNRQDLVRLVETIEVTGQRIAKIIRGMRTMAHHQEEEKPDPVSVRVLVQEAVDLCFHRFESHGIKLEVTPLSEKILTEVRSHQIVQVLVNLLNNSFDAIAKNQEKWVRVEVADFPDRLEIAVVDSGRGIPEDLQKKIFSPFFSTKMVRYGTGLGLSISQSLVQKNKGTLEYDRRSLNTRFVLTLPKLIESSRSLG